jgi:branched-chain amino acid transport system ATP-binding protein
MTATIDQPQQSPTAEKASSALQLRDVRKQFGQTEIIRGVDLEVQTGKRHALIGPNGAGKSTLFHLISGRIALINRLGLSRSFQVTNIFPRLTVFENIRCSVLWQMGHRYAFWYGVSKLKAVTERCEQVMDQINLSQRKDTAAGVLTYAEQRALEIGLAIAADPKIIILDEPTAGMSRSETAYAVDLIRKVSEGKTLFMVEHDMSVVFGLADRISVLVYGQVIASDTPERIRGNQAVREAYLGQAEEHTA